MSDKKLFRILIADDNQASRKGLRALLNSFSHIQAHEIHIEIVGEAENGRQAAALAQELAPDLIFMDIEMPHLNGLDATNMIKKELRDTKIIILSMHGDQREAAFQKGADDFIVKGTDTRIIKQAVLRMFNQNLKEKRSSR